MDRKIIIAADKVITCLQCGHHFPLDRGLLRQTIERYENEFDEAFASQRTELEETLEKEVQRRATRQFAEQIAKLQEQLSDSKKAERKAKELIAKAQADARAKAAEKFSQEKKALADELAEKEGKLKEFREQEPELRKQKKELEEQQANLQLELAGRRGAFEARKAKRSKDSMGVGARVPFFHRAGSVRVLDPTPIRFEQANRSPAGRLSTGPGCSRG